MRLAFHLFGNSLSLVCDGPIITNTNLEYYSVEGLPTRLLNSLEGTLALEILHSGLCSTTTFPPAVVCPKLILECIKNYNARTKSIKKKDGSVLIPINREMVTLAPQLPRKTFSSFSPAQSIVKFNENRDKNCTSIAKSWLLNP